MSRRHLLSYAVIISLFFGCEINSGDDPDAVINIPIDFKIGLWENLSQNEGRTFSLILESSQEYECENYNIDYNISTINTTTSISLNEIIEPADCAEGLSPAIAALNFPDLDNGFHPFRIILKNSIVNEATLEVTDSKYSFNIDNANGIDLSNATLNKMPQLTIWGIIDYEDNMTDKANAFLDDLSAFAHVDDFEKGNYGHFSIQEDEELIINNVSTEFENASPFLYKYTGDETAVKALVESANEAAGITITLFTSTGEQF